MLEYGFSMAHVFHVKIDYVITSYTGKLGSGKAQPPITCSKLTIETLEQGVKHVQS